MLIDNTDLMPDASEIVHYDDPGLPLYIRLGELERYPHLRAAAHWHEDLELIEIEQGEMNYSINGESVLLKKGDSLFVNSRQLHFGYDERQQDCLFLCMLIHPSLLEQDRALLKESLRPMLDDDGFPYFHFSGGEETERVREILHEVWRLKETAPFGYRVRAVGLLTEAAGELLEIWHAGKIKRGREPYTGDPGLHLARRMVAFIEENYAENLTLDGIAESGPVSRSTCCRMFRKYVHTSPLEFLNNYRLQEACDRLRNSDASITEIASDCGFNHGSYFSRRFQESFGCTPREYRKGS